MAKLKKNKIKSDMGKAFPITSVCREDLIAAGYTQRQVEKLDDIDMEEIASGLANAYCDDGFWIDLPIITDNVLDDKKRLIVKR